jgi:hypothetical protein
LTLGFLGGRASRSALRLRTGRLLVLGILRTSWSASLRGRLLPPTPCYLGGGPDRWRPKWSCPVCSRSRGRASGWPKFEPSSVRLRIAANRPTEVTFRHAAPVETAASHCDTLSQAPALRACSTSDRRSRPSRPYVRWCTVTARRPCSASRRPQRSQRRRARHVPPLAARPPDRRPEVHAVQQACAADPS